MNKFVEAVASDKMERYVGEYEDLSECIFCYETGYGFLEHKKDCLVLEARAIVGKCPHGYPANYNHSGKPCKVAKI